MAANSKIEWCDCTYQVVTGCTKVSPGCLNCYAEKMAWRLAHNANLLSNSRMAYSTSIKTTPQGEKSLGWSGIVTPIPGAIDRMYDELSRTKKSRRVFVQSMGDLFHEGVPFDLLDELFSAMVTLRRHTFMCLTKRPKRMKDYMDSCQRGADDIGGQFPWSHIWPGITVCTQAEADEKIPILLNTPAAVRFVSVEPMLGPVDFSSYLEQWFCRECGAWEDDERYCATCQADRWELEETLVAKTRTLDWIICGCETGPDARPMDLRWARDLRDQCKAAGVPFFFKSAGPGKEIPEDLIIREFLK